MKKLLAVFIVFTLAFSFGISTKTEAMNISNEGTPTIDVRGAAYDKFIAGVSAMSDEKLEGIQIELTSSTMIRGEEQMVRLIGLYSGGVKKPISSSDVKWDSVKPTVATISSGKLQALAAGDTTLIARYSDLMATEIIQVQDFKELPHEANVPTTKAWNVRFNGEINILTVKNIVVLDDKGSVIPVDYKPLYDKKDSIIRVSPASGQGYTPGKSYTLWVKDVQSLSGKSLKHYTKMDFTIKK